MQKRFKIFVVLMAMVSFGVVFSGCDEINKLVNELRSLGWFGDENLGSIENDVNLDDNPNLPASIDLRAKFPPIGDQGEYGTCVSWAVGYNLKTVLEGIDKQRSQSDLANPTYQFSPKDLFWSIGSDLKGDGCNGTSFEAALDILVNRGIARMSVVPYSDLGDCSSSPQSDWTAEANNFKIENYREVTPLSPGALKEYLSNGRPVVFGAQLGDNFMNWNSSDVLTTDTDTYQGQHAYHAMILAGYDNSKGPNGAFLVVNSWNTQWGNSGYIWVDYNFFVQTFCFAAFVAQNKPSDYNPDGDGDGNGDGEDIIDGQKDLLAWYLADGDDPDNTDPLVRKVVYNVFNMGSETVPASSNWSITYIYYDAYDANNYGFFFEDYYTDQIGAAGENGYWDGSTHTNNAWYNHVDVPGGYSVARAVYGGDETNFSWGYTVPAELNGQYYFVMIADAFDNVVEYDESNNYYYLTTPDGGPLTISNGLITQPGMITKNTDNSTSGVVRSPDRNSLPPSPTAKTDRYRNTYSPKELTQKIMHDQKTGAFQKKYTLNKAIHDLGKRQVAF